MIYEFALYPSFCSNWYELKFFLQVFGAEEGRLISDIPRKKWMIFARQEINASENGQLMKKRLKVGIEKLARKAMYRRNYVPIVDSLQWIDHAIAAHKDRPFRAILTDCYDGVEDCILRNDHELIENCRWKIPFDNIVKRSAANMIEAICPMIDCSQVLTLIDRNFDPDKFRWRAFIIEIAIFLSKRNFSPSIKTINYHVGNKIAPDHMELLCKKHFLTKIHPDMKLNFILWPWDELHDRYVLTDVGGVKFGVGLDVWDGQGSEYVEINRISEKTRTKWWKACKSKQITFSLG